MTELKGERESSTTFGDFNTSLSIMDSNHYNQTEDNNEIEDLNNNKSTRSIQRVGKKGHGEEGRAWCLAPHLSKHLAEAHGKGLLSECERSLFLVLLATPK